MPHLPADTAQPIIARGDDKATAATQRRRQADDDGKRLERLEGIEPSYSAWKAEIGLF